MRAFNQISGIQSDLASPCASAASSSSSTSSAEEETIALPAGLMSDEQVSAASESLNYKAIVSDCEGQNGTSVGVLNHPFSFSRADCEGQNGTSAGVLNLLFRLRVRRDLIFPGGNASYTALCRLLLICVSWRNTLQPVIESIQYNIWGRRWYNIYISYLSSILYLRRRYP